MTGETETVASGASARKFEIEGKVLGFPSLYPDGSSAVGLFSVPARAAQALIRDSGFEVAVLQLPRVGLRPL
ncbi:MAG: hypothetical protein JRE13_18265 [Deltaproteobacteria bacterium]|nr:hypothetical protein [Deltaproteobacteria bacterium]